MDKKELLKLRLFAVLIFVVMAGSFILFIPTN